MKKTIYESKISSVRWIAYDLPGNVGWILYFICLGLLWKQGVDAFSLIAAAPALLMLVGIAELVNERIHKLDWVLPKNRLYRGFGALTLGGATGMIVALIGLVAGQGSLCAWMLAGSALCALFAYLIFREYRAWD